MSFDLSNRSVLITGASSGLGRHLAVTAARNGAKVILAARRTDLLAETAQRIADAGGRSLAVPMDVTNEASILTAFDAAEHSIGPVDSVIANAGMTAGRSALAIDAADYDAVFAVNTRGVFLTVREAARRMIASGSEQRHHGRIVLVSSVTAQYVQPGNPIYSASKAAVNQLGRVLARDWSGKGINVNVVAPGYMRTELTDDWLHTDKARALLASFPRGRVMDLDVLDPIVLYLCSDASAQVTGSIFTIDDGQTL